MPALLPDNYCPDVHERLMLYKRLSDCEDIEHLTALREELIDRFGQLPNQVACLIQTHRLRIICDPIGIERLDATEEQIVLQFREKPNVDAYRIIQLIQNHPGYKMAGQNKLMVRRKTETFNERIQAIEDVLAALTPSASLDQEVTGAIEKLTMAGAVEKTTRTVKKRKKGLKWVEKNQG
jgi:transcription-repair coupling factor (superfamily II helicase)